MRTGGELASALTKALMRYNTDGFHLECRPEGAMHRSGQLPLFQMWRRASALRFRSSKGLRHTLKAVFTLAAIVSALPAARLEARQLTLEDFYRIVSVQAPAMAPGGKWGAFVRSTIVEAENRRQGELWIVPADGSAAPRRISDPALNVSATASSAPRWSPDGQLLSFTGRRRGAPADDDGGSIWFVRSDRLDGPAEHIRGVEGTPIFSPDNKWIAFTK